MGDLFFILRMAVYTVVIVMAMQVKIGDTTVEEKVIHWTHTSSVSSSVKDIAEGAVRLLGIGYNRAVQNVDSSFSKNYKKGNIPGKRLQEKLNSTKEFLKEQFESEENPDD